MPIKVKAEPERQDDDGGWKKHTPFPLIQGTDCCGLVVSVANDVDCNLVGKRVLIRPSIHENGFDTLDNVWMGSDFNAHLPNT